MHTLKARVYYFIQEYNIIIIYFIPIHSNWTLCILLYKLRDTIVSWLRENVRFEIIEITKLDEYCGVHTILNVKR